MEWNVKMPGRRNSGYVDLSFCPAQSTVISLKETHSGLY